MKTKRLSITNVDFRNEQERTQFEEEEVALFQARKKEIVADLIKRGQLTPDGQWIFRNPLPDDMEPDSPADFKH